MMLLTTLKMMLTGICLYSISIEEWPLNVKIDVARYLKNDAQGMSNLTLLHILDEMIGGSHTVLFFLTKGQKTISV